MKPFFRVLGTAALIATTWALMSAFYAPFEFEWRPAHPPSGTLKCHYRIGSFWTTANITVYFSSRIARMEVVVKSNTETLQIHAIVRNGAIHEWSDNSLQFAPTFFPDATVALGITAGQLTCVRRLHIDSQLFVVPDLEYQPPPAT